MCCSARQFVSFFENRLSETADCKKIDSSCPRDKNAVRSRKHDF